MTGCGYVVFLTLSFFCAYCCLATTMANAANINTDMTYIKMCNRTSPVNLRTMNEILINKKLTAKGSESSSFKCFLHCLFTKYGWMDEEGGFFLHRMKNVLEEADIEIDSLEFILYKCTAIESVDKCERSFVFTECFWKRIAEQQTNDEQLFYNVDEDDSKFP